MLLAGAGVGASSSCAAGVEGDRARHRKMCARGDSTEVRTTSAVQGAAAEVERESHCRASAGRPEKRPGERQGVRGRQGVAVDATRVALLRAQRRPGARISEELGNWQGDSPANGPRLPKNPSRPGRCSAHRQSSSVDLPVNGQGLGQCLRQSLLAWQATEFSLDRS